MLELCSYFAVSIYSFATQEYHSMKCVQFNGNKVFLNLRFRKKSRCILQIVFKFLNKVWPKECLSRNNEFRPLGIWFKK